MAEFEQLVVATMGNIEPAQLTVEWQGWRLGGGTLVMLENESRYRAIFIRWREDQVSALSRVSRMRREFLLDARQDV